MQELINTGLGLLQTLALNVKAQQDIMRCRFMELLPTFLGGDRPKRIREKSLSILQHLTTSAEHAEVLLRHNVVILIVQEVSCSVGLHLSPLAQPS